MEHVVSPSGAEKKLLRAAIEQEIQQFLDHGGKITVLKSHLVQTDFRISLWREGEDDLMADE
jgi:hypothetical protein